MPSLLRACRAWLTDRKGVSAIEFAFGAPAFITLLLAGFDTTRYIAATRRLETVASTIGQMVSVSTTGQLAPADLQFYEDSTMVVFPLVLQDSSQQGLPSWASDINITVSGINFTGSAPPYTAKTAWSVGSALRPCVQPLAAVADTTPPSPGSLPTDTFGPGSMIVVDISYTFRPTISLGLLSARPIARSFYVQPRYVTSISYTGAAGPTVNQC